MIWWLTGGSHEASISPFVRNWLRSSGIDRLLALLPIAFAWILAWGLVALIAKNVLIVLIMSLVPFAFLVLDALLDRWITGGELDEMLIRDDVILATRAEYLGGHPGLPHGRFVYLTLTGSRENPLLTVVLPGSGEAVSNDDESMADDPADECFDIPLLDIDKHDPKAEEIESPALELLASLSEKAGKMFSGERVTLNVRYQGPGGRKHIVELTNFFHGNDEVRNWRNHLVCAQAEADTGVAPRQPWKSLKSDPAPVLTGTVPLGEVSSNGHTNGTGNGSQERSSRSAFERR